MKRQIDLNCDMGESYGKYVSAYDADIMPYISSCNIACGFHSGDPVAISKTLKLAKKHDVAVGAHPSYPDLQGFGRRVMNLPADELEACVLYQTAALKGMAEAHGTKLHHLKPHGALYNQAARDEQTAKAIVAAVRKLDPGLTVYAPFGSVFADIAEREGLKVCSEVFADRSYEDDLSLRSRTLEGSVLHQKQNVLNQLEMMVLKGLVPAYSGKHFRVKAQTVCLHSDTPGSARLAKEIHDFLRSNDVEISSA